MEQLSGLDAAFLNLESNAVPMHVGCVSIFRADGDNPLTFERVVRHIESRLHLLPAFRRRLVESPMNLDMPWWIEDPEFDIEQHVHRRSLPAPGSQRELDELVRESLATRLDREKPLWEILFVEGLQNQRVAVLAKIHHACIDGISGAEVMSNLLDAVPEPPPQIAPRWKPERPPAPLDLYRSTLKSLIKRPMEAKRLLETTVPKLFAAGRSAIAQATQARMSRDDGGSSASLAPRTRFNTRITARRSYASTAVDMEIFRRIKAAFGCSANDVLLAVSGEALRHYLKRKRDLPALPLVAGVPVSVRNRTDRGRATGNHLTFTRCSLATNLRDPIARLQHIAESMRQFKTREKAVPASMLGDWAEVPAPALMGLAARLYENFSVMNLFSPPFNLIISNVPGPRSPLYFAGAEMLSCIPTSIPYHGLGFNITALSYRQQLNIGMTAHRETVPDLNEFLADWHAALQLYLDCANKHTGPHPRGSVSHLAAGHGGRATGIARESS